MTNFNYGHYDATGLAHEVAQGRISPRELLEMAIERAQRINEQLNFLTQEHFDEARTLLDNLPQHGQFRGVPMLLKDLNTYWQGTKTSEGSRAFGDKPAQFTSTFVQRLLDDGMLIFGKTSSPEFGVYTSTEPVAFGPARNPWNPNKSAGGSSGGAAAAVAAGVLPIAHATDGGGSIRIPASACGLVGFKPTRARTPAGPNVGEGWAGASIGHTVSRTVRDSAAMLDVLHGYEPGAPYAAPPPASTFLAAVTAPLPRLHIAYSLQNPAGIEPESEVVRAFEACVSRLKNAGHELVEIAPDIDGRQLGVAQATTIGSAVRLTLETRAKELGTSVEQLDVESVPKNWYERSAGFSGADYVAATRVMHATGRTMAEFHQTYDVYLTPTLAKVPIDIGIISTAQNDAESVMREIVAFAPYTALMNLTGQPSVSLPLGWSGDGLPIGMCFSAAYGADELLFALAGELERQESFWGSRRPQVFAD